MGVNGSLQTLVLYIPHNHLETLIIMSPYTLEMVSDIKHSDISMDLVLYVIKINAHIYCMGLFINLKFL